MGLFTGTKKDPVILKEGARCDRCGKRIRRGQPFVYIKGKLYCERCAEAKRDWDFLAFHALIDD